MEDWHDSMTKLFKGDPVLTADVLRECMSVPLRKGTKPKPLPQVLSSKPPTDLIPDLVFAVGTVEKPSRVIVVEIQSEMTAGKRRQWPRYAAALWLEYECPVDLLVICPDEATARACSRPLPTLLERYDLTLRTAWPHPSCGR